MHSQPSRRTRRRRSALVAAVVTVAASALMLPACGGDDDTAADSSAAQSTNSADPGSTMDEFQQCMADNGVDFGGQQPAEDGGTRPSIDQDAMEQAQEACGDLMPEGGARGQGGPGGGLDSEALQAWTDCLADNGVEVEMPGAGGPPAGGDMPEPPAEGEVPDSQPDGERPDAESMFGLDTSDPEVAAAIDSCKELQPDVGDRPAAGADGTAAESGEAS